MTASRRLLYGETSRIHCSGMILAHSSIEYSKLEGSVGLFYEFRFLVLFSIGFTSDDSLKPIENFLGCVWNHGLAELSNPFPLFHPGTVGVGTDNCDNCKDA